MVIHFLLDKFKNGLAKKFLNKYSIKQMVNRFPNEKLVKNEELAKRFLDEKLGKDEEYKTISEWEILEDCRRSQGEEIQAFVEEHVWGSGALMG